MTRAPQVHPAIPTFTVGFRAHPTDKEAIRHWIAKRVRVGSPEQLRKWLAAQIIVAEEALSDLAPIKTHPNVKLARTNARAHLAWATAARKELLKQYPKLSDRLRFPAKPPRSRVRVGSLKREAEVFVQPDLED